MPLIAIIGIIKGETHMKRRKKSNGAIIGVLIILILAAAIGGIVFLHVLPKREIKALTDTWKSGDIDSVMGVRSRKKPSLTKEEKEFNEKLLEEYGDMLPGQEQASEDEVQEPLLENILAHSDIKLKTPFIIRYPCKVGVIVTGPDMVALLRALDYESYSDGSKLFADVKAALDNQSFAEKTSEIEVEIGKEGKELYLVSPSPELVDILYGGTLSLYAEEEIKLYEELFGQ